MENQKTIVERYLKEMGLASEWYVVTPVYGDIKDEVVLQKDAPKAMDVKTVRVQLSYKNLQVLPPDKAKRRIADAIKQVV